jgi:hypothetical protein
MKEQQLQLARKVIYGMLSGTLVKALLVSLYYRAFLFFSEDLDFRTVPDEEEENDEMRNGE